MDNGLTLPKIEVNQEELTKLKTLASTVMEEAQDVARKIENAQTRQEAEQWARDHLAFAKHLREKSWIAEIRDKWRTQWQNTCAIIEEYAAPHEIAVKKTVNPAVNIQLDREESERAELQRRVDEAERRRAEDAALARAEALSKQGKTIEAEAVLNRPPQVVTPRIEPVNTEGIRRTTVWKVVRDIEEDDAKKLALVIAVRDGQLPLKVLDVNYGELDRLANSYKGKMPGSVETRPEQRIAYTSQRRSA